jgi:fatty-acid desaturase
LSTVLSEVLSRMATEVETEVKEAGETQEEEEEVVHLSKEEEQPVERLVVWTQVVKFSILHCLALYGLTLLPSVYPATIIFLFLTYLFSALGTTAGNHRLWAHKSYKVGFNLKS